MLKGDLGLMPVVGDRDKIKKGNFVSSLLAQSSAMTRRKTQRSEDLIHRLVERQSRGWLGQIDFYKSQAIYWAQNIVPSRYRWLIPELQEAFRDLTRPEEAEAEEIASDAFPPQRSIIDTLALPPLQPDDQILGIRGRYRVKTLLGIRGIGRLYSGVQSANEQPIVIREYLLPPSLFTEEEIQQRKEGFMLRAGLSLADGRGQHFRLIEPWEAISDRKQDRCYLISKGTLETLPTLKAYVTSAGAMPAHQVRQVLDQVLQTLTFLHGQKYRLPSGQIQTGIVHGNLSLETLLIEPIAADVIPDDRQFLIHVCDLSLWESLFVSPAVRLAVPSVVKDLQAVGLIAFHLLAGRAIDATGQSLDPKLPDSWRSIDSPTTQLCQRPLKQFILRLLGLDTPFESAEAARLALLALPIEASIQLALLAVPEPEAPSTTYPLWLKTGLLLAILGLFMLPGLFKRQAIAQAGLSVRFIKDIAGIPAGEFTLAAEQSGTWTYVYQKENLVLHDRTLEQEIADRQPKLNLDYQQFPTGEAAIAAVQSEQADFAITTLTGLKQQQRSQPLDASLASETFAYDGLAVFVAFSYSARENGLPQHLNGQISMTQLRQVFTGAITNWSQLGGANLPVKLYAPTEAEAIEIFEQRVLQDPDSIAQFRQLLTSGAIVQKSTTEALRSAIQDFEDRQIGAIAFGTLSKVFGQCSAYPLAIAETDKAVQPLVQDQGQPINPTIDLCNDKGSYHPNITAFTSNQYPLAYPVAIVYPRDNSRLPIGQRFAAILQTAEAQMLLSRTGLVPLRSLQMK
jgi:ABC-type phosphate transport system substrate-binding protein